MVKSIIFHVIEMKLTRETVLPTERHVPGDQESDLVVRVTAAIICYGLLFGVPALLAYAIICDATGRCLW